MKWIAVLFLALSAAGCMQTVAPAPIDVTVSGPMFTAGQFDCGARPLPPDPKTVGNAAGSAAAHYENRLGTWGQHCSNMLGAAGGALKQAGQVISPSASQR